MSELDKVIDELTDDPELKRKYDFGKFLFAMNQLEKKTEINREWKIGGIEITFNWRSPKNFMGRFGGGWQIAFGFTATRTTTIFNLFVFSIRISRSKP